jgi:hypothetical protein
MPELPVFLGLLANREFKVKKVKLVLLGHLVKPVLKAL